MGVVGIDRKDALAADGVLHGTLRVDSEHAVT